MWGKENSFWEDDWYILSFVSVGNYAAASVAVSKSAAGWDRSSAGPAGTTQDDSWWCRPSSSERGTSAACTSGPRAISLSLYPSWCIRQRLLKALYTTAVYDSTESSSNVLLLHPAATEELLSADENWNAETRDTYEQNFEALTNTLFGTWHWQVRLVLPRGDLCHQWFLRRYTVNLQQPGPADRWPKEGLAGATTFESGGSFCKGGAAAWQWSGNALVFILKEKINLIV